MSFLSRGPFPRGWTPDADAAAGPVDGLLRADNLTLDILGVLALRRDRLRVYALGADAHSLYTEILNGVRYRFAGADFQVFANGNAIASMSGAGDVAFGGHLGQVLFARGSTRYKYDGTTLRNWGILPPGAAPTIAPDSPDGKTFVVGSLALTEFVITEDDGTGLTYMANHATVANGATVVHPSAAGRGTLTATLGAPTDFTVFTSGTLAVEQDIISLYVYLTEPSQVAEIDLLIDVSDGGFQTDYYLATFTPQAITDVAPPLLPDANSYGATPDPISPPPNSTPGVGPVSVLLNVGWNKLSAARGLFVRTGATNGKDWTTVRAIRVTARAFGSAAIGFDTIRIAGGRLVGQYNWVYCLAYNTGNYVALSAPSPFSLPVTMASQSATITIPADAARDPQANEVWVFRIGSNLSNALRFKAQAFTGTGALTVIDDVPDVDVLTIDIPLQFDNARPPANIIDIEGPYFDRTFVLTSDGFLWPSRRLNPDSFASGQAIRVSAAEETAYWVKKGIGGLYIGTSKDIYRLEGTGAEFPDGSVDFTKRPLNVDHPPINDGVAQDGNLLVFLSNDGWRAFGGETTTSIVGATSLLYRGQDRHGVEAVNLTGGRFRAAIARGQFIATTPEGDDTTSSVRLYRHAPLSAAWYRHIYDTALRVVYAEPDGTMLAGDTAGGVWELDTDNLTAIPVTIWTRADDGDSPFTEKEASNLHLIVDTGGTAMAADVVVDEATTAALTGLVVQRTGLDLQLLDIASLGRFHRLQVQLTGSPTIFRFGGYGTSVVARPAGVLSWDSGPIDLQRRDVAWLRRAWVKVNASAALSVSFLLDGAVVFSSTVPVPGANLDLVLPIDLGRGHVGRQPRIRISSASPFLPYWIDVQFRESGKGQQKPSLRIPVSVGS